MWPPMVERDKRVSFIKRQISIQNRGEFQTSVLPIMTKEDFSPGLAFEWDL